MFWEIYENVGIFHFPKFCAQWGPIHVLYAVGAFRGGIGADMESTDMVQFYCLAFNQFE